MIFIIPFSDNELSLFQYAAWLAIGLFRSIQSMAS